MLSLLELFNPAEYLLHPTRDPTPHQNLFIATRNPPPPTWNQPPRPPATLHSTRISLPHQEHSIPPGTLCPTRIPPAARNPPPHQEASTPNQKPHTTKKTLHLTRNALPKQEHSTQPGTYLKRNFTSTWNSPPETLHPHHDLSTKIPPHPTRNPPLPPKTVQAHQELPPGTLHPTRYPPPLPGTAPGGPT
jgi:hypothetical protein